MRPMAAPIHDARRLPREPEPDPMALPALAFRHVSKAFGTAVALGDVELEVGRANCSAWSG